MSLSDSSDSEQESSGSDQNQDQGPNQSLPSSIEDDNPDDENFGMTRVNRRQTVHLRCNTVTDQVQIFVMPIAIT